jgi:hypothetical protein
MAYKYYIPVILLLILSSCRYGNKSSEKSDYITLKMQGDINNLLQLDSLFSHIKAVPLETKDNCLISEIVKIIYRDDLIFIKDFNHKLLVFDTEGKFKYEVGKKGRGPGEVFWLHDFDVVGKFIYILDYRKIHKYSLDGTFLGSLSFKFERTDKFYSNPLQFVVKSDSGYFIWEGSLSINEKSGTQGYAMYEMSNNGSITAGYFPVTYTYAGNLNQFKRFNDVILLDPVFGSNTIYSIDKKGVKKRYYLDFGAKTSKVSLPNEFTTSMAFKQEISDKYYHSISNFVETDNWLYFRFASKNQGCNAFYSKKLQKSFISKTWPIPSGKIAPILYLTNRDEDLVGFIYPKVLIEELSKCRQIDNKNLSEEIKYLMQKLENIADTDNPILFICSLKKY